MLAKVVLLAFYFGSYLKFSYTTVESPPFCKKASDAAEQLEQYYTNLYRVRYFWRTSTLCKMNQDQKKLICAKIFKYCMRELFHEFADIVDIERQVENVQDCKKEPIEMTSKAGKPWKKKKKMFLCPKQQICRGMEACHMTPAYLVSAGGAINSALIFVKQKEADATFRPHFYMENMDFETLESKLNEVAKKEPMPHVNPEELTEETGEKNGKPDAKKDKAT